MAEGVLRRTAKLGELLGTQDRCACDPADSVLGPPAYLVRLLQFLDVADLEEGLASPLEVFLRRQPHAAHVELSAESAFVELPHPDLVNEVLEAIVVTGEPSELSAHGIDGATTHELMAEPQHVNAAAYERLASLTTIFPISLPFNRDVELTRIYLDAIGLPRRELLALFLPDDHELVVEERLRVTEGDVRLLTFDVAGDAATTRAVFGLSDAASPGDVFASPGGLVEFLEACHLSFADALDVFRTRFVNPNPDAPSAISVLVDDLDCDLQAMRLTRRDGSTVGDADLVRVHRLVRLADRTGWSIRDLDVAMRAFGWSSGSERRVLSSLGVVAEIAARTDLSIEQLASFWAPIDTAASDSLYARTFLARSVASDADFALGASGEPVASGVLLGAKSSFLASALRLAQSELTALLDELGLQDGGLSIENISLVHRHTLMMRVLGLSAHALRRMIRVTETDPFQAGAPAATLEFLNIVDEITSSPFDSDQLDYVFRWPATEPHRFDPTPEGTAQLLASIRDRIQELDDQRRQAEQLLSGHLAIPPAASVRTAIVSALTHHIDAESATELVAIISGTYNRSDASVIVDRLAGIVTAAERAELLEPMATRALADRIIEFRRRAVLLVDRALDAAARAATVTSLAEELGMERVTTGLLTSTAGVVESPVVAGRVAADEFRMAAVATADAIEPGVRVLHGVLHRLALLTSSGGLSHDEWAAILDAPLKFAGFAPNRLPMVESDPALPTDAWRSLLALARLRDQANPSSTVELIRSPPADWPSLLAPMSHDGIDLAAAATVLTTGSIEQRHEVRTLERAFALAAWANTLRVEPADLSRWARQRPDPAIVTELREALRARYDAAAWLSIARQLHDPLRRQQRDALVDFLLASPAMKRRGVTSRTDLSQFTLMSVDGETSNSRCAQVISAAQTFGERCLLGLEPEVPPDLLDSRRWETLRRFQLDVSRLRILLDPENYFSQESRHDRTPPFLDAIAELEESDLTPAAIERVIRNYVRKVQEVSDLAVLGCCVQKDGLGDAATTSVLHVFARSRSGPAYRYFHRTLIDDVRWTPWTELPVDIDPPGADGVDRDGVHLLPIVQRGVLHLYWPVFSLATSRPPTEHVDVINDGIEPPTAAQHLEIRLAWSVYQDGQWSPKRISRAQLRGGDRLDRYGKLFVTDASRPGAVTITAYETVLRSDGVPEPLGAFELAGPDAEPTTASSRRVDHPSSAWRVCPWLGSWWARRTETWLEMGWVFNSMGSVGPMPLAVVNARSGLSGASPMDAPTLVVLLDGLDEYQRILAPHHQLPAPLSGPLFIDTAAGSWFVSTREQRISVARVVTPLVPIGPTEDPSTADGIGLGLVERIVAGGEHIRESRSGDPWDRAGILDEVVAADTRERTIDARLVSMKHPHADTFREVVEMHGIAGLYAAQTQNLGSPYLDRREPWTRGRRLPAAEGASMAERSDGLHALVWDGAAVTHYRLLPGGGWRAGATVSTNATHYALLSPVVIGDVLHGTICEPDGIHHVTCEDGTTWTDHGIAVAGADSAAAIVVSGNFARLRIDVVVMDGQRAVHHVFDPDDGPSWREASVVSDRVAAVPSVKWSRRLEALVALHTKPDGTPPFQLVQVVLDEDTGEWDTTAILTEVAAGSSAMLQGNVRTGRSANTEAVVVEGVVDPDGTVRRQAVHYWRDTAGVNGRWHRGQIIAVTSADIVSIAHLSEEHGGQLEVLLTERGGVRHYRKTIGPEETFASRYQPTNAVRDPYPPTEVDFSADGPCAIYNWELFAHLPLLCSRKLRERGLPEAAQELINLALLAPTIDSADLSPERVWRSPALADAPLQRIEDLFAALSGEDSHQADLARQLIAESVRHPFEPSRLVALMPGLLRSVVFRECCDNTFAIVDQLIREGTREAGDTATIHLLQLSALLGLEPQLIHPPADREPKSFADLRADLDESGNAALEDLELEFPYVTERIDEASGRETALDGLTMPYFCIPANEQLLGYWKEVAQRYFVINHRVLPLYAPPIDPAILVRAAAAGVSIGDVLRDINAPPSNHRFEYVLRRALSVCNDARSLAAAWTNAQDQLDNETLTVRQATNALALLDDLVAIREGHVDDARQQREVLLAARSIAEARVRYSQRLLGLEQDVADFDSGHPYEPPEINHRSPQIVTTGEIPMLAEEAQELEETKAASDHQNIANIVDLSASALRWVPNTSAEFEPWGIGVAVSFGGAELGDAGALVASGFRALAAAHAAQAERAGRLAGHIRRDMQSTHELDTAHRDLTQIDRQIAAAEMRIALAETELENHRRQVQRARDELDFHRRIKLRGLDLRRAAESQLRALYRAMVDLATTLAKQAERSYQRELAIHDSNLIRSSPNDGTLESLGADRLLMQLRSLEQAYHDGDEREIAQIIHVSLRQTDPMALLAFRQDGIAFFDLSEQHADRWAAGFTHRRIRRVEMTIPATTGPYSSVNCRLTLLRHELRVTNDLRSPHYLDSDGDDDRFAVGFGSESIVTSNGRADTGTFDFQLANGQYAPFELAGLTTRWIIEMLPDQDRIDRSTINDVILTISYTCRDAGPAFSDAVRAQLEMEDRPRPPASLGPIAPERHIQLFEVRHQFPDAWATYLRTGELRLNLKHDHFSHIRPGATISVDEIWFTDAVSPGSERPSPASPLELTQPVVTGSTGTEIVVQHVPYRRYDIDGAIDIASQTTTTIELVHSSAPPLDADRHERINLLMVFTQRR